VCIQINRSTWDRQLFPNPHALTIYLGFVLTCGNVPESFAMCECENDDVRIHYQIWVQDDGHYH
jgi:hypothetical protein